MISCAEILEQSVASFGTAPRKLSLWHRWTYLRVHPPTWLRESHSDLLWTLFRNLDALYREGILVWGHIVQANTLIYEEGSLDVPGDVVYSLEDPAAETFDLCEVAECLFDLKGRHYEDDERAFISRYLSHERIRVFGHPVPRSLSPEVACRLSTTFFVRKHLPGGKIERSSFPLLVLPRDPYVVLPLPQLYWPAELLSLWRG